MKISEASWVILDSETTGLDPNKDRIVEFAYARYGAPESHGSFLVNPGMPIPCEVSAIHHLTDEDVQDAKSWNTALEVLPQMFDRETILVAHNAVFDAGFLPCFSDRRWICTKRLAMHLFPDAPSYSNQVLRYWLGGAKLDLLGLAPHRALADCIVTRFIFRKIIDKYLEQGNEDSADALIAFCAKPVKWKALPFGKHAGLPIEKVPIDYIEWLLRSDKNLDRDLKIQLTEMASKPSVPR